MSSRMWSVCHLYYLLWTNKCTGDSPVQEWRGNKGDLHSTKQGLRRTMLHSRQSLSACGPWLFQKLPHCIGLLVLRIACKEQLLGFSVKECLERKCEENIFDCFSDGSDLSYVPNLNSSPPLPLEREIERYATRVPSEPVYSLLNYKDS